MKYFAVEELQCPCCKECLLMDGFSQKLDQFREEFGHPLIINSACRCKKHNAAVGGKGKSFHLINAKEITGMTGCCAVDVSTFMWPEFKHTKFMKMARDGGWSLGIANNFYHIDRRIDYPESGWGKRSEWRY